MADQIGGGVTREEVMAHIKAKGIKSDGEKNGKVVYDGTKFGKIKNALKNKSACV